ncbi:MAG: dipeptidase [Spirosomaceae bacterium]|jgi:membrane dipeptidase|nr:dipeptidase [Spirosomataceae bacterium]
MKHFLIFVLMFLAFCVAAQPDPLRQKAREIHRRLLTIDTHTDVPMVMSKPDFDINQKHAYNDANNSTVDFPRMREGGMDAMFFAIYLGQGPLSPEAHKEVKVKALSIYKAVHDALKKYPDIAELALTAADAARLNKAGKLAVYIGMENGYPIGDDVASLKQFYDLGCRYLTLCHSFNNLICDSSTDPKGALYGGLSPMGVRVIQELNRLGIVPDLSHVSDETVMDVLRVSTKPVIASHSNARALCDVPRNLPDSLIKAIAAKGGVVQVNFVSDFLKPPSPAFAAELREARARYFKATEANRESIRLEINAIEKKYAHERANITDLVRHIDYIAKLVGPDHVGIGSDFDGGGGVTGCEDVSQIENITFELLKMGYSEETLAKIWGGNILRVLRATESK